MEILKIGVFYDGNYFLHVSNYYSYYSEVRRRLSLPGFHKFLCHAVAQAEGVSDESCRVVTSHYFRGRLSALDASHRCRQLYNDRVFDDVLMSVGIETHYLPLRTRMGRKEEKGIDVWLALEAYERSLHYKLDVVVLVSSDGEYVPLIRKLSTLGVRVMVLNWEFDYSDESGRQVSTRSSSDLLSEVSYALDVDNLINEGLQANDPIVEGLFMPETSEENPYDEDEEFPMSARGDSADGTSGSERRGCQGQSDDFNTSDHAENSELESHGQDEGYDNLFDDDGELSEEKIDEYEAYLKRTFGEDYEEKWENEPRPKLRRSRVYGQHDGDLPKANEALQNSFQDEGEEGGPNQEHLPRPRQRSRIINLISDKGYGFIEHSPTNLFFYHRDLINVGIADLREGDEVEFSIGPGRNGVGVAAKQIVLIEKEGA